MVGAGETYFSAFILFLGANNFQLAVFSALPTFMGGLGQLRTVSWLKRCQSRQKMVLRGVIVQSLSIVPMGLTYFLPNLRIEAFIILACLYTASNAVIAPVWNSWMGDLVDVKRRGYYFGIRNRVITLGTYVSMTLAGLALKFFESHGWLFWGFFLIFFVASISRVLSFLFLKRKFEPAGVIIPANRETFPTFLKNIWKRPSGPLMAYLGAVNFSVFLSAGYFTAYMLKTLHWDYTTYTLVVGGMTFMKFVSSAFWGRMVDQLGSKSVLIWTGVFISFVPLPWVFTHSAPLIFLAQCYAGLVWGGWELASFTLMIDSIPTERRAQDVGYFNIINGAFALVGAAIGSQIVDHLPSFNHPFALIFCASAFSRLLVLFIFAEKIVQTRLYKSVRATQIVLNAAVFKMAFGGLQSRPMTFTSLRTQKTSSPEHDENRKIS